MKTMIAYLGKGSFMLVRSKDIVRVYISNRVNL